MPLTWRDQQLSAAKAAQRTQIAPINKDELDEDEQHFVQHLLSQINAWLSSDAPSLYLTKASRSLAKLQQQVRLRAMIALLNHSCNCP